MVKEKVTLTLDAAMMEELRSLVGRRSLSSSVNTALSTHLAKLRHLASVDEWLADLERQHGPVPAEALEWAARLVDGWETSRSEAGRQAG
ncbi:MAG: CopG family transcriptional regulator [Acidimicrobiales bacterium]